jgi:hypothetical protein
MPRSGKETPAIELSDLLGDVTQLARLAALMLRFGIDIHPPRAAVADDELPEFAQCYTTPVKQLLRDTYWRPRLIRGGIRLPSSAEDVVHKGDT